MFDSHCHLNDRVFSVNLSEVVDLSRKSGVSHFVVPGVDVETSKEAVRISELFSFVYPSVGIHPTIRLPESTEETMDKLEEIINTKRIVAVGETGLDYYRFESSPALQKKFFLSHINLAQKHGLPIIIHTRHSEEDMEDILSGLEYDGGVILHCCPPHNGLLKMAIKKDFLIGVAGDITFDSVKAKFVEKIPLQNLLVETDSPYQTPRVLTLDDKYPNTPANIAYIVEKVAQVKNMDVSEVAEITTKNAKRAFGI